MSLATESYLAQRETWPTSGHHILAQYDEATIVVYQAYAPAIGRFAAAHGVFGGEFGYGRMSWVKPNFLWMMYRSDWGRSPGQEVVLAIRLRRSFFDGLLAQAVPSSFDAARFPDRGAWQAAVARSDVRLQWDPDHLPSGAPCARRAIQLGLRGAALAAYGKTEIVEILDVSELVATQRQHLAGDLRELVTPVERVYVPEDEAIRARIGIDA